EAFNKDLNHTNNTISTVAVVKHSKASDKNGKIDKKIIRLMIDEGVKAVTNSKTAEEAWHKIFPEYLDHETIGIKVNSANYQLPTHPEFTYSLAESLSNSGYKENKILIWDCYEKNLSKSGYDINDNEFGYLCFGTSRWGAGYDESVKVKIPSANINLPLSRILTQHCDYIINAPVLKNATPSKESSLKAFAGVTLALKNAYGYIPLNDQFWQFKIFTAMENMKAMHAHNCNPQIAELNASPIISRKTKISICDAILGIYDGGPYGPPQWIENKIIISSDMVALDTCGLNIIEQKRKEKKLSPVV
ncbi:MAG: hypothetical protein A2W05_02555, partial [Candidatus Schekmanbacteria bacterium RBG_16_38_10]